MMGSAGIKTFLQHLTRPLRAIHRRLPSRFLKKVPFEAFAIIVLLILVNVVAWVVCLIVLSSHTDMYATAVLCWSLGLRHAMDADHISAIDLMTRRLIASGQRPVTVGTFFSLGHSTIVIITSLVVAATAAHLVNSFDKFSSVGNIIGTAVSAGFLIVLGTMNAYILYQLIKTLKAWIHGEEIQSGEDFFEKKSGGPMWKVMKKLFWLINRPWKMYPLGVVFGLGFDTSSEVALLGLSSLQASKGTSIWLILCFPVLFTVGMCMIDTLDGAGMLVLYTWCDDEMEQPLLQKDEESVSGSTLVPEQAVEQTAQVPQDHGESKGKDLERGDYEQEQVPVLVMDTDHSQSQRLPPTNATFHNPLIFLYYSTVLTTLTVVVALIIGVIQLLSLLQNAIKPEPEGRFWDGVSVLSDHYAIVGGVVAGGFVVAAIGGVLFWKRFSAWIHGKRMAYMIEQQEMLAQQQDNLAGTQALGRINDDDGQVGEEEAIPVKNNELGSVKASTSSHLVEIVPVVESTSK